MKRKLLLVSAMVMASITFGTVTTACWADDYQRKGFNFYNDTDQEVEIGVGNFFPKHFKQVIGPHSSQFVSVSSDNQEIHIYKIQDKGCKHNQASPSP